MRFYFTSIFWVWVAATGVAQESFVDSLRREVQQEKDISLRIEILDQLARELLRISPEKALETIHQLKQNADSINSAKGHAHYYRLMSSYSGIMGNYLYSTSFNYEAMRVYEQLKDSLGIGNCYIAQSNSYYRQQLYAEAIHAQKKALRIFEGLQIKGRIIVSVSNLAFLYNKTGLYDSALMMAKRSMELNKDKQFYAIFINDTKNVGYSYLHTRQYDKALNKFKEALQLDAAAGGNTNNEAIAEALLGLGIILMETNNKRDGYSYLQQGVNKARENGFMTLLLEGYWLLAQYYDKDNKPGEAYHYLLQRTTLADSLALIQRTERLKLGDVYLNALRESHQNDFLIKEKSLQENLLRQQWMGMVFGIITIGVLLVLLFYLKKSNSKRKQINKILIEQKEEIAAQKNELQKLSNTKDKFFSIVAHDLRSPLNSIKSFTSLIDSHADLISKEEMIAAAKQLDDTLENTIKLTDNLLTWARQQMQINEGKPVDIGLKELVNEVFKIYMEPSDKKRIELKSEVEDTIIVQADRDQLLFIVRNLVNNAIKFTPEGGRVVVQATAVGKEVELIVEDNGIGIPEEKLARLFEIGRNTKSYGTAGEKGTGLGLILCKEFVIQNKGALTVTSKENVGSTFKVRLPGGLA